VTATKKKPGQPPKAKPESRPMTAEDFVAAVKNFSEGEKRDIAEVLGVVPEPVTGQGRTVESRPRSVEAPVAMEVAEPPPKPEPKPGVIYKSPHLGLWQVLKAGWKERFTDDDFQIHAPKIADFSPNGTWRTEDEDEVALMRKKIAKKRARGGPVDVVEVKDEIKELLDEGGAVAPVKNKTGVTVETPASELVS